MPELATRICDTCTQADELWFLSIVCRKYNIEMDKSQSGPFVTAPNYRHFLSVKTKLQGSCTAELIQDYVSKWAKDQDYTKKQTLKRIMAQQNMKYTDEAYVLYVDWAPIQLIAENPDTEKGFMQNFCREFRHLF
jgi:hypothetical protein